MSYLLLLLFSGNVFFAFNFVRELTSKVAWALNGFAFHVEDLWRPVVSDYRTQGQLLSPAANVSRVP
jgi:hypothetical protein